MHFPTFSITYLPGEWDNGFIFARQQLLLAELTTDMLAAASCEIFRVLVPEGWVELLEGKPTLYAGPASSKMSQLICE